MVIDPFDGPSLSYSFFWQVTTNPSNNIEDSNKISALGSATDFTFPSGSFIAGTRYTFQAFIEYVGEQKPSDPILLSANLGTYLPNCSDRANLPSFSITCKNYSLFHMS